MASLYSFISKQLRKFRRWHRLLRHIRIHAGVTPQWEWLHNNPEWSELRQKARNGPKVLIPTSVGSNWVCSGVESALGVALTLRGANVRFLLCDGALPACQECDHQWISERSLALKGPQGCLCETCFAPAHRMLEPLGLPVLRYSQFMDDADLKQAISSNDAAFGDSMKEHARAGTLRYYGRGTMPSGKRAQCIYDRYEQATTVTRQVIRKIVEQEKPDAAVFHHGIYVPQGIIGHVLRESDIPVVNWGVSYRKRTVLFSHGDTYHHTMLHESPDAWKDMTWSEQKETKIMKYLRSRWTGGNDWINFQKDAELDSATIVQSLGLDLERPIFGLLTNVLWDAQLHFKNAAYPSMLEWVYATVEHFSRHPQQQLVIRIHPAEAYGTVPSKQHVADELLTRFGKLPPNIKIIKPEEKISTYALMNLCNCAFVYSTKTALELACTGLPVIVVGDAWSRGKGFTIDVSNKNDYQAILAALPLASHLPEEQIQAARKYAYHFFFRRMIPLQFLTPKSHLLSYLINTRSLDQLKQGNDPGLDTICDGILSGSPFVFDQP